MVHLVKTRSGWRLILGAVVLFGVLWSLTQLVGANQVRLLVSEKYLPTSKACLHMRACECTTRAIGPFLVEARYFWHAEDLMGGGARLLFVWLGPVSMQLWKWHEIAL